MWAPAGLHVAKNNDLPHGLIPPIIAAHAVDYPTGDGRNMASTDIDDPMLRDKANEDWYRLSTEGGLFRREDPQFLVAIKHAEEKPATWAHAELTSSWDIMGAGADGLLGSGFCRPEFVMLSLDGRVICCGTTWQFAIGTVVITAAQQSPFFRNFAKGIAESTFTLPEDRDAVLDWLRLEVE